MKIRHDPTDLCTKRPVGELPAGTVIVNGEGNICLVCRDSTTEAYEKIRIVNLQNGGTYTVQKTCLYEAVEAELVWKRRSVP